MKTTFSILLCLCLSAGALFAQKGSSSGADAPITWLGLDFTMCRFIGDAHQFKDAGEITPADMREKYFPAWNQLFINEQKKYDVAKYVRRDAVDYAIDVTAKANDHAGKDIFSNNPSDFSRLSQADIEKAVKGYNFQGKKGVGLLFFVEGMSKGQEKASAWVTYVDMDKKRVLKTERITGKAGGFGFRNYWAKAFLNILKDTESL